MPKQTLSPKNFPSLFKLGLSVANESDNLNEGGRPRFIECGCCGMLHPVNFGGDCRDDDNRFAADQLDAKYGSHGWEEIYNEE